jgi:integrase
MEVIKPILDGGEKHSRRKNKGMRSTASQVLSLISGLLTFAHASEYRADDGNGIVDLKGPLGKRLPRLVDARERVGEESNASLDHKRVPEFMRALREFEYHGPWAGKPPIPARALEFLILIGARTHMVTGRQSQRGKDAMKWSQVDWEEHLAIWTPHEHKSGKKTNKKWIIPLSKQAMAVLEEMRKLQEEQGLYREDGAVFVRAPSVDKNPYRKSSSAHIGKPIDHNTLWTFLRGATGEHGWKDKDGNRISPDGERDKDGKLIDPESGGWRAKDGRLVTPHGFRETFGTWCDHENYDERDSEIALGHAVGSRVRNIYKKNAHRIEQRRIMMQDWANECGDTRPIGGTNVTSIRPTKRRRTAA